MKEYDLGILVSLNEEFRILTKLCTITQTETHDAIHYHILALPFSEYKAVAVVLGDMGKNLASHVTEKVLNYVRPEVIVLLGIAGALDEDLKLGDIVVANEINEFQAASKAVQKGKSFVFQYSGNHWKTSFALMQCAGNFEFSGTDLYNSWRNQVRDFRSSLGLSRDQLQLANDVPEIKVGHIASGDSVGASEAYAIELQGIDRKFLALEMEAAGFAQAAYGRKKPVETLVIRGISDFADERKKELDSVGDGVWRKYAMHSASVFFLNLLRTRCFRESVVPNIPVDLGPVHQEPYHGEEVNSVKADHTSIVLGDQFNAPDGTQIIKSNVTIGDQLDRTTSKDIASKRINSTRLRWLLETHFDEEELHTLCFDLNVDYDSLRGESKAAKTRELVAHLQRRERVNELVAYCSRMRPNISWEEMPGVTTRTRSPSLNTSPRSEFLHTRAMLARQNADSSWFEQLDKLKDEINKGAYASIQEVGELLDEFKLRENINIYKQLLEEILSDMPYASSAIRATVRKRLDLASYGGR